MSLSSAVQGARHTAQRITWTREDGSAQNLSGATLSARMVNVVSQNARDVDGTLTVVTAGSGIFDWEYGENDVAAAGVFRVQFVATYSEECDVTFEETFEVRQAI